MDESLVLYSIHEGVATITLNRPQKRNALNVALIATLDSLVKAAEEDRTVNVIILTGAGSTFSSGHDLDYFLEDGQRELWRQHNESIQSRLQVEERIYKDKCLTIRNLSKPVIGQVRGYCLGAGLMLAAMCDLVVASETARFGDPVLRMASVGVELLVEPWAFGVKKAKELLWTGEFITAEEAWRLGFVNKVVRDEELENETRSLAGKIALMPPFIVALTKRSMNRMLDMMGQSESFEHHFVLHQLGHAAPEWKEWGELLRDNFESGKGFKGFLRARDDLFKEGK